MNNGMEGGGGKRKQREERRAVTEEVNPVGIMSDKGLRGSSWMSVLGGEEKMVTGLGKRGALVLSCTYTLSCDLVHLTVAS